MSDRPYHLWVAITGHGLGHLTQTAPLVEALRLRLGGRLPGCRITLQTHLSEAVAAQRIARPFHRVPELDDIGMAMASAIDVLPEASLAAYREIHANWPARLGRQIALLQADPPDLLLANVSYLALAGAQALGIPNVGICSLNWADIFAGYCGERPETGPWIDRMRAIYAAADLFLRPQPSMPMAWLPNARDIGPITTLGCNRRAEVCATLGIPPGDRLVLITLGGIPMEIDYNAWAREPGVQFIVQGDTAPAGGHVHPADPLGMPFPDLMASVDAVVTKPGYGTFAKAGCLGKPVLYVPRGDWPEEPYSVAWLHRHTRAAAIERDRLSQGRFVDALDRLLTEPAPQRAMPTGAQGGAELIVGLTDI